jgi:deoxyribodipyrimidine photo-lyase
MRERGVMGQVAGTRVRVLSDRPVQALGSYVLYWMTATRRTRWNFALQRAVDLATTLRRPLVVLEALRCDYPWANVRHHRFILDGIKDNAERFQRKGIAYYPYVEPEKGAGRGLLKSLAKRANIVVADDSPSFFYPRMLESAARQVDVRMEAVDSNGLFPVLATDRVFTTASSFRRFLQKTLPDHLIDMPRADPLRALDLPVGRSLQLPVKRWPAASQALLDGDDVALAKLPIDGSVRPTGERGGEVAAGKSLNEFLREKLEGYDEERNLPQKKATSRLSAYLHYGQISSHQVVHALLKREGWTPDSLGEVTGSRTGWWGLSAPAEAYLDQLVTWRELGFNKCAIDPLYDRFESLPGWARKTLRDHQKDPRPHVYTLEEFETSGTHDALWNAAQNQLVSEGRALVGTTVPGAPSGRSSARSAT